MQTVKFRIHWAPYYGGIVVWGALLGLANTKVASIALYQTDKWILPVIAVVLCTSILMPLVFMWHRYWSKREQQAQADWIRQHGHLPWQ